MIKPIDWIAPEESPTSVFKDKINELIDVVNKLDANLKDVSKCATKDIQGIIKRLDKLEKHKHNFREYFDDDYKDIETSEPIKEKQWEYAGNGIATGIDTQGRPVREKEPISDANTSTSCTNSDWFTKFEQAIKDNMVKEKLDKTYSGECVLGLLKTQQEIYRLQDKLKADKDKDLQAVIKECYLLGVGASSHHGNFQSAVSEIMFKLKPYISEK